MKRRILMRPKTLLTFRETKSNLVKCNLNSYWPCKIYNKRRKVVDSFCRSKHLDIKEKTCFKRYTPIFFSLSKKKRKDSKEGI